MRSDSRRTGCFSVLMDLASQFSIPEPIGKTLSLPVIWCANIATLHLHVLTIVINEEYTYRIC